MTKSEKLAEKLNVRFKDFSELEPPRLWKAFVKTAKAMSIRGKRIYVRDLRTTNEYDRTRILCHESRHIEKQRKWPWSLYVMRYYLSKSFRRSAEVWAYARTIEWHFINGRDIDASPYVYAMTIRDRYFVGDKQYRKAQKQLIEICDEIKQGTRRTVRNMLKDL